MTHDRIFIGAGLVCLMAGLTIALWFMTPVGGDLRLLPSHVQFNLLGWATLAIFGLIHRLYPDLARSRLANLQMILAVAGAVLLPFGFGLPRGSTLHIPFVASGAFAGFVAAILFSVMFVRAKPEMDRP